MLPDVFDVTPKSIWIVVVFPAPFGPKNPTIFPLGTENEIPSTALNFPKFLTKFSTFKITSVILFACTKGIKYNGNINCLLQKCSRNCRNKSKNCKYHSQST